MQLRGGTFVPTLCGSTCSIQSLHQQNQQQPQKWLNLTGNRKTACPQCAQLTMEKYKSSDKFCTM